MLPNVILNIMLYTIPIVIVWYGFKRLKTDKDKEAAKFRLVMAIFVASAFFFTITAMLLQELKIIN